MADICFCNLSFMGALTETQARQGEPPVGGTHGAAPLGSPGCCAVGDCGVRPGAGGTTLCATMGGIVTDAGQGVVKLGLADSAALPPREDALPPPAVVPTEEPAKED